MYFKNNGKSQHTDIQKVLKKNKPLCLSFVCLSICVCRLCVCVCVSDQIKNRCVFSLVSECLSLKLLPALQVNDIQEIKPNSCSVGGRGINY